MKKVFALLPFLVLSCASMDTSTTRTRTAQEIEAPEFAILIKQDSINKHQNAAESLDVLLNENSNDSRVSVIINNNSNCNIIVRISGNKSYNLPIRKNFRNFILIEKGTYSMGANLCRARYSNTKTFGGSTSLTLSEN